MGKKKNEKKDLKLRKPKKGPKPTTMKERVEVLETQVAAINARLSNAGIPNRGVSLTVAEPDEGKDADALAAPMGRDVKP